MCARPIPSRAEFEGWTTTERKKKRKKLYTTDKLLEDWQDKQFSMSPQQKRGHLNQLLDSISYWLEHHKNQPDVDGRKAGVIQLHSVVIENLPAIDFAARKAYSKALHPQARPPEFRSDASARWVKHLEPQYRPERTMFEDQRTRLRNQGVYSNDRDLRIDPIAGTYVHLAHRNATLLGHKGVRDEDIGRPQLYEDYHDHTATGYPKRVAFFRKHQRIELQIAFYRGKLHRRGVLLNTLGSQGGISYWMYAMDLYGNLFTLYDDGGDETLPTTAIPGTRFAAQGQSRLNHSSLNAGREVICAGTLMCENGMLTHIDNQSGHYAPNAFNLAECINTLRDDEGVDISGTTVNVRLSATQGYQNLPALTFLANPALYSRPGAPPVPPATPTTPTKKPGLLSRFH